MANHDPAGAPREAPLPEVVPLTDARGERPETAAGIGAFWYDTRIWNAPVSPIARVLYAALCSFIPKREANRHDLRRALEGHSDGEIKGALDEMEDSGFLSARHDGPSLGYEVRAVSDDRASPDE